MEPTRSEGVAARASQSGVVCGCQVESATVRSFLRLVSRPRFGWATAETTVAGGGAAATLSASGDDRFQRIREQADTLLNGLEIADTLPAVAQPRLYGGFSFTTREYNGRWDGFPSASFVLPSVQLTVASENAWLTSIAVGPESEPTATAQLERWRNRLAALPEIEPTAPPGIESLSSTPTRDRWRTQVTRAVERIRAGDLRKVVLAQSLTATLARDAVPADILARLSVPYPDCDRFLFAPVDSGTFFGATPERLVTVTDGHVTTEALAGSIGRGDTDHEDDWLAQQLHKSEKNAHEHELVVEAIRDQLSTVATDIEIGTRDIRKLATVQHLRTPIRAQLDADVHVLALVEALHPTPAVGGLPPDDALATIRETEAFDRGWYAAPVGWFDGDGNGTFSVAIRSGIAAGKTVTMFAGAGIVADSDPDQEWDEVQLKYRPVLDELS